MNRTCRTSATVAAIGTLTIGVEFIAAPLGLGGVAQPAVSVSRSTAARFDIRALQDSAYPLIDPSTRVSDVASGSAADLGEANMGLLSVE